MIRRKASVVTQKPAGTRMPSIRDSAPRCAPLPPTTATCISSTSCRPSTYCSLTAIPPGQPCSVAQHRPVGSPAPPALPNLVLGTSASLVAFPPRSRPAAPPSRAARTPAPPRPAPATTPPVPPAVRRHRVPVRRQQHTHVVPPCLRPFLVRLTILGARPGSCRKPPGPLHVKVARNLISLPLPMSSAAD